jgi:aryl-alcohol dehydrogenase-like predicted oxidoreductase
MPMRRLGRTGVDVSLVGLGGYHIGQAADEQTAVAHHPRRDRSRRQLHGQLLGLQRRQEPRLDGRALRDGYRKRVFLMTKIDGRTRKAAAAQIDQSLRDLGTDVIDLMQIHEVIRDSDPAPGVLARTVPSRRWSRRRRRERSVSSASRATRAPPFISRCSRRRRAPVTFDTVQMPLNVMDAHYDSFERRVAPVPRRAGSRCWR